MDVERDADYVLLENVVALRKQAGALFEILRIAQKHVTFAALRTVELHDYGSIDFRARTELARHVEARPHQPLALELATRFPVQHRFVAEVRNSHSLVLFERQIRDE